MLGKKNIEKKKNPKTRLVCTTKKATHLSIKNSYTSKASKFKSTNQSNYQKWTSKSVKLKHHSKSHL